MADVYPIPTRRDFKNLTGMQFGDWTVLSYAGKSGKNARWNCRCECGTEKKVQRSGLICGTTKGCGCRKAREFGERKKTHGHAAGRKMTNMYGIWAQIIQRCTNPSNGNFKNYGGRGIKVCDRWRNSFEAFHEDMAPRPSSLHTIDRVNNDGNYEKSNCEWKTQKQQMRNTRECVMITFRGKTQCLSAWAEETGLTVSCIDHRLRRACLPVELALTLPKHKGYRFPIRCKRYSD